MGTVKFWQGMDKASNIVGADKMMIGKNETGEAQYVDFQEANQFLSIQGIEMKPVPAGALPAGPTGETRTMEILEAGTWTYGGNSFVNPSGSIMKLWWNGTTWSLGSIVELPTKPTAPVVVEGGEKATSQDAVYQFVKPVKSDVETREKWECKSQEVDNSQVKYPSNFAVRKLVNESIQTISDTKFGGTIDNTFDLTGINYKVWFFASAGQYVTQHGAITLISPMSILAYDLETWTYQELPIVNDKDMIVVNTINELRTINPYYISLIDNGNVKGVTVLGYYSKDDYVLPVDYYLTGASKQDNYGSVIHTVSGAVFESAFKGEVSATSFGIVDDGIDRSANVGAFIDYCKENGLTAYFPVNKGGVYFIDNIINGVESQHYFSGANIKADLGVKLSFQDSGYIGKPQVVGNDIVCSTRYTSRKVVLNDRNIKNRDVEPSLLSLNDADYKTFIPVDMANGVYFKQSIHPGSDIFADMVVSESNIRSATFTPDGGNFGYVLADVLPKYNISAQFDSIATTAISSVIVRTSTSKYYVFGKSDQISTLTLAIKKTGHGLETSDFNWVGLGSHGSYGFAFSNITIRIINKRKFALLLNGMKIKEVSTDDDIIQAGFGSYEAQVTISDMVITISDQDNGIYPINIAVFGDSRTTDKEYQSWTEYLPKYLGNVAGLRIHNIYNYAVSGAKVSDQKMLCTPSNIANADIGIIDIGTNDIQSQTDITTFTNDLQYMITTLKNNNKKVILGVPDLFYGRGQVGDSTGQDTTNYERHRKIRQRVLRLGAENGCYVVAKDSQLGFVLSFYLNGQWSNLGLDPIMYDNIHPTTYARMLIALEYSKAIIAVSTNKIG